MSRHDDQISIRQMLDHADEARQLASGRNRADLDSDRVFALAMTRLLEIVGEAAARVSTGARDKNPGIAWSSIVGLRNRLIHAYDQVDYDILWVIVENDLPLLIKELEAAIDEELS